MEIRKGEIKMLKVELINPCKQPHFYINPLILQQIKSNLEKTNKSEEYNIKLIDYSITSKKINKRSNNVDIAVFNTPFNSYNNIRKSVKANKYTNVIFVGDTIKTGDIKKFLAAFKEEFPDTKFFAVGFLNEHIIGTLVTAIKNKTPIGAIQGTSFLNNGKVISSSIHTAVEPSSDKTYSTAFLLEATAMSSAHTTVEPSSDKTLFFSDEILAEYKKRGMQIFLDGLTRGCKNCCNYCPINCGTKNKKIKVVNQNNCDTLTMLSDKLREPLYIQFTDENFFDGDDKHLKRIQALCRQLQKIDFRGKIGIDTRVDTIINESDDAAMREEKENTWRQFSQNGLGYVYLGIETFSMPQLERYNKKIDVNCFEQAINFLDKLNVKYTIGLILWDPLMKLEELEYNLDYIKKHCLLGKTASLLKELRIPLVSNYFFNNQKTIEKKPCGPTDFVYLPRPKIAYVDDKVANILLVTRKIHDWFTTSGYRHSDVARFEQFFDVNTPTILQQIPEIVSKMEFAILRYLTKHNPPSCDDSFFCINECYKEVKHIYENLQKIDKNAVSGKVKVVYNYYTNIFKNILVLIEKCFSQNNSLFLTYRTAHD